MSFGKLWAKTVPPDTGESPTLGAGRIRDIKTMITERLPFLYGFDVNDGETDETQVGGKYVPLMNQGAKPTAKAGFIHIYAKTVSSVIEFFVEMADGTEIQITSGGALNINAVLLTGDQTIAGVKTFSSIPVLPASSPTTDNQAVRKKYVDDLFASVPAQVGFGSPVSKSINTIYQATTDGIVSGYTTGSSNTTNCVFSCYTDSNSSPSTLVQYFQSLWVSGAPGQQFSFSFPVKKNDYYKVTSPAGLDRLTFTPLGS